MAQYKLGKKAATYDRRDLRFADLKAAVGSSLPKIPAWGGGYGMDFGSDKWLMLGNGPDDTVFSGFEGCGDCVWAGAAHEIMEMTYNAKRSVPKFSGKTVVNQYSAYSGYDPRSGNNDTGSDVREVMSWRQKKGFKDDSGNSFNIVAYVSLEPQNLTELQQALYLFNNVGIGFEFPDSAMDQFDQGQVWSVVPGAQIDGGHYVPLVGHPTQGQWTAVTWGRRQVMTPQFITQYVDEAWAYVTPERYNAVTGETPQGYKDVDLEKFLTLL